jgi:hypothetical protein
MIVVIEFCQAKVDLYGSKQPRIGSKAEQEE